MNFVSFMDCALSPTRACMTSVPFLAPFAMLAVLVAAGYLLRRRDKHAFRRIRRRALMTSSTLVGLAVVAISAMLAFDPTVFNGGESSALAETLWLAALASFGGAVALLLGALALALGGWIAKKRGHDKTARKSLVIAIDGPAASGKGTLAKRIAEHYKLPNLDTGLLYRAVARDVIADGGRLENEDAAVAAARALDASTLHDSALRGPAAGDAASIVARIAAVRAALLDYQRAFAAKPGGAVLDGRDIGTVVCPNADVKIFVTATAEERARRRHLEHVARGEGVSYDDVLADIRRRDARDSSRDIAPLEVAADAAHLDTTGLDADQVFAAALEIVKRRKKA